MLFIKGERIQKYYILREDRYRNIIIFIIRVRSVKEAPAETLFIKREQIQKYYLLRESRCRNIIY